MNSYQIPTTQPRKMRVFFLSKQTGRISYVTHYSEHELVLSIMHKGPDWSYVTNDAGLTVEVTPLPPKKGL